MITLEEYKNIQVGDYIQIVDRWNEYTDENEDGDMDYLLGQTFEVTKEATETTVMKGTIDNFLIDKQSDNRFIWYLNLHCIAKVIKRTENLKSIDDKALEKMLEVSV